MRTVVGVGDPKAIKRWSAALAVDVPKNSYFGKKFTSRSEKPDAPVQEKIELENEAGDTISYDLSMQLRQRPIEGDARLEGKQENLKFYTDTMMIDQMRGGVSGGGRMTRKRTLHDLRAIAKARMAEWWGRVIDELHFMYISGARGVNPEFIYETTYAGFAGNPLLAPDSGHLIFGGDSPNQATSAATITSTDTMTRDTIERATVRAKMLNAININQVRIQPIRLNGEDHYVTVMSPYQEYSLRQDLGGAGWLDVQKAAAAAEGRNNPIFMGSLGMLNDVVLHSHENVIQFNNYGAGANLPACRALFMGAQAAVVAYGNSGNGARYNWVEETLDLGNEIVIGSDLIWGIKKCRFNGYDFGVIALDTYATNPS
jgi:N4-gp56 family major capsid protein